MTKECLELDVLLATHYEALIHWCRSIVPSGVEAEDIVHAAYLRIRHGYRADRASRERPLAFVRQSIRWEAADWLRSDRRRRRRERVSLEGRAQWDERSPLGTAAAHEALSSLRGRQRQVCLALLSGKRREQVCGELKMRPGALDVCLSRARATLVRQLEA